MSEFKIDDMVKVTATQSNSRYVETYGETGKVIEAGLDYCCVKFDQRFENIETRRSNSGGHLVFINEEITLIEKEEEQMTEYKEGDQIRIIADQVFEEYRETEGLIGTITRILNECVYAKFDYEFMNEDAQHRNSIGEFYFNHTEFERFVEPEEEPEEEPFEWHPSTDLAVNRDFNQFPFLEAEIIDKGSAYQLTDDELTDDELTDDDDYFPGTFTLVEAFDEAEIVEELTLQELTTIHEKIGKIIEERETIHLGDEVIVVNPFMQLDFHCNPVGDGISICNQHWAMKQLRKIDKVGTVVEDNENYLAVQFDGQFSIPFSPNKLQKVID